MIKTEELEHGLNCMCIQSSIGLATVRSPHKQMHANLQVRVGDIIEISVSGYLQNLARLLVCDDGLLSFAHLMPLRTNGTSLYIRV